MSVISKAAHPHFEEFKGCISEHMDVLNGMDVTCQKVNTIAIVFMFCVKEKLDDDAYRITSRSGKLLLTHAEALGKVEVEGNKELFANCEHLFEKAVSYGCAIQAFHFSGDVFKGSQRILQECNPSKETVEAVQRHSAIFDGKYDLSFLQSLHLV